MIQPRTQQQACTPVNFSCCHHCLHHAATVVCMTSAHCCGCRFLAEAPEAHSERVQQLLPYLAAWEEGLPFLLPALVQNTDLVKAEANDASQHQWLTAIAQPEVGRWVPH